MKRYLTMALAIMIVCMCFTPCLALAASADSLDLEEPYVKVAAVPLERGTLGSVSWSYARSPQLNFGDLEANDSRLGATCFVTQGKTVLKVNRCTWDSGRTIFIGFLSLDGGQDYGVVYSSGHIQYVDISTENMPTGNYAVWVKNKSEVKILSGILDYEVIG